MLGKSEIPMPQIVGDGWGQHADECAISSACQVKPMAGKTMRARRPLMIQTKASANRLTMAKRWYSEATERREVPKTNRRASTKAVSKCHGSQNLGFLEYPIFIEEKTG